MAASGEIVSLQKIGGGSSQCWVGLCLGGIEGGQAHQRTGVCRGALTTKKLWELAGGGSECGGTGTSGPCSCFGLGHRYDDCWGAAKWNDEHFFKLGWGRGEKNGSK